MWLPIRTCPNLRCVCVLGWVCVTSPDLLWSCTLVASYVLAVVSVAGTTVGQVMFLRASPFLSMQAKDLQSYLDSHSSNPVQREHTKRLENTTCVTASNLADKTPSHSLSLNPLVPALTPCLEILLYPSAPSVHLQEYLWCMRVYV